MMMVQLPSISLQKVVGTGVTFNTAGISTGNLISVGAGATYGYAVISSVDSASTISITDTNGFVPGLSTVPSGSVYAISAEPGYTINQYGAPEAKEANVATQTAPDGYTKLITSSVFGVDTAEQQSIGSGTTATLSQKQYGPAHAGWVGITTYTDMHGNLRVKTEVLVAMSKDSDGNGGIQNDADSSIISDDTELPDSI